MTLLDDWHVIGVILPDHTNCSDNHSLQTIFMLLILALYTTRQTLSKDTEYTGETFQSSSDVNGAAIFNSGYNLTLANCIFEQCSTTGNGGAIYFNSVQHAFRSTGCIFSKCSANAFGASYANVATVTMLRNSFVECTATNSYAGFYVVSHVYPSTLDCSLVAGYSAISYIWILYGKAVTLRRTNTTHGKVRLLGIEFYLHAQYGPVDLKFALGDSNTATEGGVMYLAYLDSTSTASHIVSTNGTFGDTYKYFMFYLGSDPCISQSYFEIGRETELVFINSGSPVLTLINCWIGVTSAHFSRITTVGCHFDESTVISFEGECEYPSGSTDTFTAPPQILQLSLMAGVVGILFAITDL